MIDRIAALLLLLTSMVSLAATAPRAPVKAPAKASATGTAAKPAATGTAAAKPVATRAAAKPAAPAPQPRLYLSWNAPYGTPRAAASIDAACGDTSAVDTLYLSFDPGRTVPDFRGLSANLYFHSEEGATLGEYWKQGGRGANGSPLTVSFASDPDNGFETPWITQGAGAPFYDFVSGSGRLRLIYAISVGSPVKAGNLYGFARVFVRRPAAGIGGCGAPMCVEWHSSWFAYSLKDEKDVNRGDRWVSINSPEGKVCRPVREVVGAKTWKPGQK